VTTKSGSLKFEAFDKLTALTQLAKILGMAQDPQTQASNNATVNVQQVNIGGDNALEAVRRLAFAIAKVEHLQALDSNYCGQCGEARAEKVES
jgi:transcriptional regulator of heat shock response